MEIKNNIEITFNLKALRDTKKYLGKEEFEKKYKNFYDSMYKETMRLVDTKYIGHIQIVNEYQAVE